jgi:hypothetical protein
MFFGLVNRRRLGSHLRLSVAQVSLSRKRPSGTDSYSPPVSYTTRTFPRSFVSPDFRVSSLAT